MTTARLLTGWIASGLVWYLMMSCMVTVSGRSEDEKSIRLPSLEAQRCSTFLYQNSNTASNTRGGASLTASVIFVRCDAPDDNVIYVWRCPQPLVWNDRLGGCVENDDNDLPFGSGGIRALPELAGVMNTAALSAAALNLGLGGGVGVEILDQLVKRQILVQSSFGGTGNLVNQAELPIQSTGSLQPLEDSLNVQNINLPTTSINVDPAAVASDAGQVSLADIFTTTSSTRRSPGTSSLSVNPCLQPDASDDLNNAFYQQQTSTSFQGGASRPRIYRAHPDTPYKYIECVPERRLIIIRRCPDAADSTGRPTVWVQRRRTCIDITAVTVDSVIPFQVEDRFDFDVDQSPEVPATPVTIDGNAVLVDGRPTPYVNPCRAVGSDAHDDDDKVDSGFVRRSRYRKTWWKQSMYHAYPGNELLFIQCDRSGRPYVHRCPAGLRWNQRLMTCDRIGNGRLFD